MDELKVHILRVITKKPLKIMELCSIYEQGVITDCKVQLWLARICSGDTLLRYKRRAGNSSDLVQNFLRELVVSVSLFNGISTFVGYLMPKPFS